MNTTKKYFICAMLVTKDEKDAIKTAASSAGLNVSDYLRLKTGV